MALRGEVEYRNRMKARRRALRQKGTSAEALLWRLLRNRRLGGRKFRRQHSIGPYILDFYCEEEQLAIELDGAIHDDLHQRTYDHTRTKDLNAHGIHVLRFRNNEVFQSLTTILKTIAAHFSPPGRDVPKGQRGPETERA